MSHRPDYILDLSTHPIGTHAADTPSGDDGAAPAGPRGRPWLSIYFRCCQKYSRVYRNRRGTAYEGRCPGCAAAVRIAIGPDGTSSRFFEAE